MSDPYSCFDCDYYNPGYYLGPGINPVATCIHKNGKGPIPNEMDTEFPGWCPLHLDAKDKWPDLDKLSGLLGDAVRTTMTMRREI